MFKFLKSILNSEEQQVFDLVLRPWIIYSIINLIFMFAASKNIGILNEDVFGGIFISWITNSLIIYFTVCYRK